MRMSAEHLAKLLVRYCRRFGEIDSIALNQHVKTERWDSINSRGPVYIIAPRNAYTVTLTVKRGMDVYSYQEEDTHTLEDCLYNILSLTREVMRSG